MPRTLSLAHRPSNTSAAATTEQQQQQASEPRRIIDHTMKSQLLFCSILLSLISLCCFWCLAAGGRGQKLQQQTYIVQVHPQEMTASLFESKLDWHHSFLAKAVDDSDSDSDSDSSSRLIYSYDAVIEGFAARLDEDEAAALRRFPGVVSVRPDRRLEIHTTYSHKFLGLSLSPGGAWARAGFGKGTIIGILDTGVWPESPSFDDRGMPPVPTRWKGVCQHGENFSASNCNSKLIGARFYSKGHSAATFPPPPPSATEYVSPRDAHGHGTHTSSTAAGATVPNASVLGIGSGEAQGTAPGAHIAIYKVCWFSGCYSSDILAGMDDAVRDGVDILSLSLGGFPIPLFEDSIAIGSFRAVERGVSVVCAAGNNGPIPRSVANEAPWITTVGASTMDRRFPAVVRTGDGQVLYGESMYPGNHFSKTGGKELELVYVSGGNKGGEFCYKGSLPKALVSRKMVVCDRGVNGRAEKSEVVKEAGGAGMILANADINAEEDSVDVHVLPATLIGYKESIRLKSYINSTRQPTARLIFGGTTVGRSRAPAVALFSSRGPSLASPSVLKPDIVAPGVNIIAAWPENLGPSGLQEDNRRSNFSVLSGTSMACPHASGITALVRSAHPSWSPAAIRSAIMTTADIFDHYGKPIMDQSQPAGFFAMGAGHINPVRAIDPGLIYDINPADYITHLCTLGYTSSEIFTITHRNTSCRDILKTNRYFSLNYPSISVAFKKWRTKVVIQRAVTNAGPPNSIYAVHVSSPKGVRMRVTPHILTFKEVGEKKGYRVRFESRKKAAKGVSYAEGQLIWANRHEKQYKVRSPISVTWTG